MFKRLIIFVILLSLLLPVLSIVAAEDESPKITALRGSVQIYKMGGYRTVAAYKDMLIDDGDTIITDINSSVTINYYKKEIVMGECTQLAVNSIWNRHECDDSSIVLVEGMIKNRVDVELNKNSKNEIRASNTIAGVRGTEYILIYAV